MTKFLVIVESPTKAKTISKFLGQEYLVKSSMGHIRDLPTDKLGVDIKKDFNPTYEVIKGASKIVKELSGEVKKADEVYIATDEDREGEAIGWHLVVVTKADSKNVKRVVFHEITKEAINEAFKTSRSIDMRLVNAQQARRILDRLVGYTISPLLGRKLRFGLSAGRVQSVALKLIVEREREIEKFKEQEYWSIKTELSKKANDIVFLATLIEKSGKKYEKLDIENEQQSQEIVKNISNLLFRVFKIIEKQKKKNPPPPFTTSSLQQEAVRKLGFSPQKTMTIAQQLYEGVDIGEKGITGLITYMRTDSLNIAKGAQEEAIDFIKKEYGQKFLPSQPRVYKTKTKGAQEAHEAIRPTSVKNTSQQLQNFLTQDQFKLYTLIWKRFLASQMDSAIFDTVSVDIKAGDYLFRATGQTLKFSGFMELYTESQENNQQDNVSSEQIIPSVSELEELLLRKLIPEQHFTEPPPRFNEATLIKTLEKNEIGRPSTYAPIISTILNRGYVSLRDKKFYPEKIGVIVDELLVKNFPKIVDVGFTAKMEEELDEIAIGKRVWTNVLKEFYIPFSKTLLQAQDKMNYEEICSKCGKPMVIKKGPFGNFLACTGYPECKNTISLNTRKMYKSSSGGTQRTCEKCGKPMVIRQGKKGKFIACSGFPVCRNVKPLRRKTR